MEHGKKCQKRLGASSAEPFNKKEIECYHREGDERKVLAYPTCSA